MKNAKLIIALIAPLILSGCGSTGKVAFNDDLKVERELTAVEAAVIKNNVAEKIIKELKGFAVKATETYEIGHMTELVKSDFSAKIYSDLYAREEGSYNIHYSQNGMSMEMFEKGQAEFFDNPSQKSFAAISEFKDNTGKQYFDLDYIAYTDETAEEARENFYEELANEYNAIPNFAGDGYLLKGGSYAFVSSVFNEASEYVGYDDGTREYRYEERNQVVLKVDKNFKVTSYTTYSDKSTNRDPSTGEWFKKLKSYNHEEVEYTYSYGKRASSGKLLTKAIEKVSGECMSSPALTAYEFGVFNKDTNTYTKSGNLALNGSDDYDHVGLNKYDFHFVAIGSLGINDNAILLKAGAPVRANYSATEYETKYVYYVADGTETVTLENGDILMLVEPGYQYNMVFDSTITAQGGALSVENRTAYIGTSVGI